MTYTRTGCWVLTALFTAALAGCGSNNPDGSMNNSGEDGESTDSGGVRDTGYGGQGGQGADAVGGVDTAIDSGVSDGVPGLDAFPGAGLDSGAEAGPAPPSCATGGIENLVTADTAFASAFFPPAVARANGGSANAILSPYSVSNAMMMVDVGALGETEMQIETVLQLPDSGVAEAAAYLGLACEMQADASSNGNALEIANSLWGQQGVPFETAFLDVLGQGYGAPLQTVDFESDPTAATATINNWVSQTTQGNVPSLLGPADVGTKTRLVLVNAIYFKGQWATGFNPTLTAPAPFTLADGTQTMVTTMTGTIKASVGYGSALTVLELPYLGNTLAMDVLMPTSGTLATFESTLSSVTLSAALASLGAPQWFSVYLPRFSVTTRVELASVLEGMGMTDAFNSKTANLSGMDGAMDLSIGAVVQQAHIDVDEQGTVAAAGTGVSVCSNCLAIMVPPTVQIDRPFLFLIRDLRTQAILFMGQVVSPG
jgi:serpin B